MIRIVCLASIVLLLVGPTRAVLLRARWAERAPRATIVLWQSIGAATGASIIAICVLTARAAVPEAPGRRSVTDLNAHGVASSTNNAMSPEQLFGLTAALIVLTLLFGAALSWLIGRARDRARTRMLIDLLGRAQPGIPNTVVVPSTLATAFSLPGLRGRIVVSTAAREVLDSDELAAVIAHERVHVRARHDLVLLPFHALACALPGSRAASRTRDAVSALVEMAADDRVRRVTQPDVLASALCRLAVAAPTDPTADAGGSAVLRRVERTLVAQPRANAIAFGSVFSATAVLALPALALALPLGR